ncbi:hypothetical protein GCM10009550_39180 [Actinocorallia libanotica]|uniref:Uncharacterized protein n=1 Tax=Actinocorallia libanotica TaxID=46162 RepID=A0ABN1RCR8_9ACTN
MFVHTGCTRLYETVIPFGGLPGLRLTVPGAPPAAGGHRQERRGRADEGPERTLRAPGIAREGRVGTRFSEVRR